MEPLVYSSKHAILNYGQGIQLIDLNWAGEGRSVIVTHRSLEEYTARNTAGQILHSSHIRHSNPVCEWGAGLGGLVEFCVDEGIDYSAIDPANFEEFRKLLTIAIEDGNLSDSDARVSENLRNRCSMLLEGRLINNKVSCAISEHPELYDAFGMVVDNQGACAYSERESEGSQSVNVLDGYAAELLRPGGQFFKIR